MQPNVRGMDDLGQVRGVACRPAWRDDAAAAWTETAAWAAELLSTRCNVSPKRLGEPGPTALQVQALFEAAATAPDHGLLQPWRFIVVPPQRRADLGEVFMQALIDRDPGATPEQLQAAREKAHRAPLLMLVVARLGQSTPGGVPDIEKMVSVGAAVQNMLLMAHAMGLGAGLTSGQALHTERMARFFGLQPGEQAVCFVNVGTVVKAKPARLRPEVASFVSSL